MELPRLISSLLNPRAYPHSPVEVRLLQTHISYILLTPEFAYKIKKPVNFGFLDFTALDKRLYYCEEEVRLNRRLAPSVYLGVVKITLKDGRAFMEGAGEAVEYAVKMKRIPDESILERALEENRVTKETVERVASTVAAFHAKAATSAHISAFGSLEAIRKNTEENFAQTKSFMGKTLSKSLYEKIKTYTEKFLDENAGLFLKRVRAGFIRDCHGDIHCEHISIDNGINIFDCIEFNERFRYSDVVADASFLSMDLDFHNRHDLARSFDDAYFAASGDKEGKTLLDFYKCYRAYVRGKVEGFKAFEKEVKDEERFLARLSAMYHFHLSGLYASGGFRPMMLVIRGLSGTGKTTVADAIASDVFFVHLSSDAVRKELAGLKPYERVITGFGKDIYSDEFTEKTYWTLIERGGACLKEDRSVILDATFSKVRFIEAAEKAALQAGAEFHAIECVADDETVKRQFEKREAGEAKKGLAVSDARFEIYLKQKEAFEAYGGRCLRVDSALPLNEKTTRIFEKIFD